MLTYSRAESASSSFTHLDLQPLPRLVKFFSPSPALSSTAAAQVTNAAAAAQATFLQGAVSYKKKIGFNGTLLIESSPQEPTKHQYDWDAATTTAFLSKYGLFGSTFFLALLLNATWIFINSFSIHSIILSTILFSCLTI